jgi:hypothetical protein
MAEATGPTNKLYAKVTALLVATPQWIALDSGDMSTFSATNNALVSEAVGSGLARTQATVSSNTIAVTNDACQAYVSFASNATANINGAGLFSASSTGDLWTWHRWAAMVPAQAGDTLNETIKNQSEAGA